MKRYDGLWAVLALLSSLLALPATASPDFFQVSSLKTASGGSLVTGEPTEGSFTVTSNFQSPVEIGAIELVGSQGGLEYKSGWHGASSCVDKELNPGSPVTCKMTITAGASLPDTQFSNLHLRVRLKGLENWTESLPFSLRVTNPSRDSLELLTRTPFAGDYQQSAGQGDILAKANYTLKNRLLSKICGSFQAQVICQVHDIRRFQCIYRF